MNEIWRAYFSHGLKPPTVVVNRRDLFFVGGGSMNYGNRNAIGNEA